MKKTYTFYNLKCIFKDLIVKIKMEFEHEYNTYGISMNQALLPQINKLNKKQYLQWVHTPFNGPYSRYNMKQARLFKSNFFEAFSYTNWYTIPLVWIPIALYYWSFYIKSYNDLSNIYNWPLYFLILNCGFGIWSFLEYSFHRFIFHIDDKLPDWNPLLKLHFLLHGVHHKIPNDPYRLVMPPAMFGILSAIGYAIFKYFLFFWISHEIFSALFGSTLIGYVCYDMMHYAGHHFKSKDNSYFGKLRRYHMKHHYLPDGYKAGFGITTKFWDYIFGTLLKID